MAGRHGSTHQYIAKPFLLYTLLTRLSSQDTHDIPMQKLGVSFLSAVSRGLGRVALFVCLRFCFAGVFVCLFVFPLNQAG